MAKKQKKSVMEEELEVLSRGKTCTKEEEGDRILKLIRKHADEISKTKRLYLDEDDVDSQQYSIYSNIESAFDILIDDLRKEGFAI